MPECSDNVLAEAAATPPASLDRGQAPVQAKRPPAKASFHRTEKKGKASKQEVTHVAQDCLQEKHRLLRKCSFNASLICALHLCT